MAGQTGGKSATILHAELVAAGLAVLTVTRCAHCSSVVHRGRADDGHEAFLAHLRVVHPSVRVVKRRRHKNWVEQAAAARVRERAAKEAA